MAKDLSSAQLSSTPLSLGGLLPPSFEEATNRRQKARAAGLDPDYWYPVEYDERLEAGQTREVVFWKRSIAIFRGQDGQVRAVENRCAHRQVKLSLGVVEGCNVVCPYHGWAYDGEGRLASVPHDFFGKNRPDFRIRSFPVQIRYGLIWIFPGDPEKAQTKSLPEIPELEGKNRWSCVPVDFTWRAHHSMIIDNVSDFTHAYLHRRFRPFTDAKLKNLVVEEDRVLLSYDTKVGDGPISKYFVNRKRVNTNSIELGYEYPYQWSNTDNKIKHWCFVLPIDERTTRSFFLFYFKALDIPFTSASIPRWAMAPFLRIANRLLVKPLLTEDGFAVEAEQEGYDSCFDAPVAELNPAVHQFQRLTVKKWEEYLRRQASKGAEASPCKTGVTLQQVPAAE